MTQAKTVATITFRCLALVSVLQGCDKAASDASTAEAVAKTSAVTSITPEPKAAPVEKVEGRPALRVRFGTEACDKCVAAQCNPYRESVPFLAECVDSTCEDTFACFQRNRCTTDADTVNQCYCGPVSNEACLAESFVARGPCAKRLHDAFGTSNTRDVFGQMFGSNTSTGDGAALFRCAAELCLQECVTDPAIPAP